MGVFDKVFAGERGIANKLISLFGGTITVVTLGERKYDEETDTETETVDEITVTATQPNLRDGISPKGQDLIEAGANVVYDIPSCALANAPEPRNTRIKVGNREFSVKDVESVSSGEETVLYRVYCSQ